MQKPKNYVCLAILSCALCFALTGCGNNTTGSTSGNNDENAANDVGNAVDDIGKDVGDAVDDVADGIGDAVEDLVGNRGFNNYDDAHDYFMDTMGSYHADAKFELRDEDRNLNDYQEGSKGYRFNLYDTSKNEAGDLFGEFYVDATSGTIYKKGENDSFEEYPGKNNSATSKTTNNNSSSGNLSNNTMKSNTP